MIGVPGSGKSTWLSKQDTTNAALLSTDNYIESQAINGQTYNDVFKDTIKAATIAMNSDLKFAIESGKDIYWDQTNLNAKSRKGKLANIPDDYEKIAVIFPTPDKEELKKRLDSRPGKSIPGHVMQSMIQNFTIPTEEEGFDQIITV